MKDPQLKKAKEEVLDNLDAIQLRLDECVDEGMLDRESAYHNELVDLIDDAEIVTTWEELSEIVTIAKALEMDIDTWLAIQGRTSISLHWPEKLS